MHNLSPRPPPQYLIDPPSLSITMASLLGMDLASFWQYSKVMTSVHILWRFLCNFCRVLLQIFLRWNFINPHGFSYQ